MVPNIEAITQNIYLNMTDMVHDITISLLHNKKSKKIRANHIERHVRT